MNLYSIVYRLDLDSRGAKRIWEDFANSKDHAIELLSDYVITKFRDGQASLFDSPNIIILSFSEYLDVFKPLLQQKFK